MQAFIFKYFYRYIVDWPKKLTFAGFYAFRPSVIQFWPTIPEPTAVASAATACTRFHRSALARRIACDCNGRNHGRYISIVSAHHRDSSMSYKVHFDQGNSGFVGNVHPVESVNQTSDVQYLGRKGSQKRQS